MRAIVEYDGSGYAGFQRQSSLPSIQGTLEQVIGQVTCQAAKVRGAGRTDAGAHATGQVVSFMTDSRLDDSTLLRAVNARLPKDVVVRSLDTVANAFDPRRDATRREYHYLVFNRTVASPLWRHRAHYVAGPLDIEAMRRAASVLIGIHDFAAFGSASFRNGSTTREIFDLRIVTDGELVRFEIVGSSFLKQMIRSIVGSLIEVGRGRLEPETIGDILESHDRARSAPPVPAHGLYLVTVSYGR